MRCQGRRGGLAALAVTLSLSGQTPAVLDRYAMDAGPSERWRLPRSLREVSGLAVTPDGRVFAHDDERAVLYQLDPDSGRVAKTFHFGEPAARGDFEGVAWADDRWYLVTSRGRLYEAREGPDGRGVRFNTYDTGVGRFCEVEGLEFDPDGDRLLLLCKTPRTESLAGTLAVFAWPLNHRDPLTRPLWAAPVAPALARVGLASLHPSGIARHPETGHYLVVAAQEEVLAELDPSGRILTVRRLPADVHRQIEGLAVLADGTVLMADEGGRNRARLSRYRPR